jgi:hypothetical protein
MGGMIEDLLLEVGHLRLARDGTINVGENVYRYLLEMRRRKLSMFLWIDAICIDQNNENDKAMQIPRMRFFLTRGLAE